MIPLIRSGSMMPLLGWLDANGRDCEELLRAADLTYVLSRGPDLPVPLFRAIDFLVAASAAEGIDFACRAVSTASVGQLGGIGAIIQSGGTVGKALGRVVSFSPQHTTHLVLSVLPSRDGLLLRHVWGLRLEPGTRHLLQAYAAALFQAVCIGAGARPPVFGRISLMPHPVHGLDHLQRHFGMAVEAAGDNTMELFVPTEVATLPLPEPTRPPPVPVAARDVAPLRGDGSLSRSAKTVTESMLCEGMPTVERLAAAAGMSVRTLQRRLGEEGNSFSDLLEAVRRELALKDLALGGTSIGEVARTLGYGQASSFTRAVRRWVGAPPRTVARRRSTGTAE